MRAFGRMPQVIDPTPAAAHERSLAKTATDFLRNSLGHWCLHERCSAFRRRLCSTRGRYRSSGDAQRVIASARAATPAKAKRN